MVSQSVALLHYGMRWPEIFLHDIFMFSLCMHDSVHRVFILPCSSFIKGLIFMSGKVSCLLVLYHQQYKADVQIVDMTIQM